MPGIELDRHRVPEPCEIKILNALVERVSAAGSACPAWVMLTESVLPLYFRHLPPKERWGTPSS